MEDVRDNVETMDDIHYSYSRLQKFDECKFAYYLEYVEEPRPEKLSNAFAEQGTLIHNLIDEWAKGLIAKEDLPYEYERRYSEAVQTKFPRMLAAKGYTEKAYNLGKEYFENFDGFEGYTIIDTESEFNIDLAGRNFTGFVDMILEDNETHELIILDHKSKSLSAFKSAEKEMWKQQYLYSKYVYEKYGRYPDKLMFNLFKENGLIKEKKFDYDEYLRTIEWAENMIQEIEDCSILTWMECKKQDFFCTEICSVRMNCPNGKR